MLQPILGFWLGSTGQGRLDRGSEVFAVYGKGIARATIIQLTSVNQGESMGMGLDTVRANR